VLHRALEGAELARDGMPVVGRLRDLASDACADGGGFAHRGRAELAHQRVVEQRGSGSVSLNQHLCGNRQLFVQCSGLLHRKTPLAPQHIMDPLP
jgi:hypothetical protein